MQKLKEKNYTIEFLRFSFAINFLMVHVYMVYARAMTGEFVWIYALDNIMPFMIFAGFFMMHGFKRQQPMALEKGLTPGRQAWNYLRTRFISLMPAFFFALLIGFIVNHGIVIRTPLQQWPLALLSHIGEFSGLQIFGIGFGNMSVGAWGNLPRIIQLLNAPLWFISGLFIVGYFVTYLLAKNESRFLAFIGPVIAVLFYGSQWLRDSNPFWFDPIAIGDFLIGEAVIHMFIGLWLGCIIWVAVNSLKDKTFSTGMKTLLTIAAFATGILTIYRTWVPVNIPFWGQLLPMNWGSMHILTIFLSFIILLNVDGFTWLLNRKIWKVPGRLAFYIYMFHFPIIIGLAGFMNTDDMMGLHILTIASTIVTIIVSYIFMIWNDKVLQPWFAKQPWFVKQQTPKNKDKEALV